MSLPWIFAVTSIVVLVVFAPLVPDEPFHLSGVMMVVGIAGAFLGLATGIGFRLSKDPELQEGRPLRAALLSGLTLLGVLAWFYVHLMSQLS